MELDDLKRLLEVIDIPIKWAAIGVGALWTYRLFVKKRVRYPKGALRLSAHHCLLTPDGRLVRVSLAVQNTGEVLLSLRSCRVWIQQIRPLPQAIAALLAATGAIVRPTKHDADWPIVAEKDDVTWAAGQCEIEPGESQTLDFDLVVPAELQTVLVYAYLKNVAKADREIGWEEQTILEFAAP